MKRSVGIDIGTEAAKIVSLEHHEDRGYVLTGYGYLEHQGDSQRLKQFLHGVHFPKASVRVNIECPSLKIRRFDLPPMEEEEKAEAVKWGLKDIVGGDVDHFRFRAMPIDPEDCTIEGKMPVLAIAIRHDTIQQREELLQDMGLGKADVIEPDAGALALAAQHSQAYQKDKLQVIVNLGGHAALFAVVGKRGLLFSRPLGGGSESHLVDHVARDVGVSAVEAQKRVRAFWEKKEEDQRFHNAVSQFFSHMAIEIQRSMDGYQVAFSRKNVEEIFLCGGGVYYHGIVDYLSQTLGLKVSVWDPFEDIKTDDFEGGSLDKRRALFAVACGLALD